jgi:hypothetical protein
MPRSTADGLGDRISTCQEYHATLVGTDEPFADRRTICRVFERHAQQNGGGRSSTTLQGTVAMDLAKFYYEIFSDLEKGAGRVRVLHGGLGSILFGPFRSSQGSSVTDHRVRFL